MHEVPGRNILADTGLVGLMNAIRWTMNPERRQRFRVAHVLLIHQKKFGRRLVLLQLRTLLSEPGNSDLKVEDRCEGAKSLLWKSIFGRKGASLREDK